MAFHKNSQISGFPNVSINDFGRLISPAITIALLGAIESLLSARVSDGQINDRHDPNQELVAQGCQHCSATVWWFCCNQGDCPNNHKRQNRRSNTDCRDWYHALVLLSVVLVSAPLASYVPLATLSAIVMVVAVNMGEWHRIPRIAPFSVQLPRHSARRFCHRCFRLTIAVELGMVLAVYSSFIGCLS